MGTTLDQHWLVLIWQRPSRAQPLLSLLQRTKDRLTDCEMTSDGRMQAGMLITSREKGQLCLHVKEMLLQRSSSL